MTQRQSTKMISLVAVLFLAGGTALAQGNPAQEATPSGSDKGFVMDTVVSNHAQDAMSQLAQHKSTSDDVQQFSGHMTQIHDQIEDQMKPYLKAFEMSEPKKPSKQEKLDMAKLDTLSGADFDAAYVQAMVKEQEHWLKEFQNEAKSSYPYLQKLATQDIPILTQNFTVLQQIAKAHNVTLESK